MDFECGGVVCVGCGGDQYLRMMNMDLIDDIFIGGEVICFGQFFKFVGFFDFGGDVKEVIIDGYVIVNGEVDCWCGCQLYDGDFVFFEGCMVCVCF